MASGVRKEELGVNMNVNLEEAALGLMALRGVCFVLLLSGRAEGAAGAAD